MDLGIKGRRALVCAASRGLGYACAASLAIAGADVVITGRDAGSLRRAALKLSEDTGARVDHAIGDIATPSGRESALSACPDPDILVTNCGGPPPGDIRGFGEAEWLAALQSNMLAPLALVNATLDAMIARKFGRVVNITSSAVKAPIASLGMSAGARAGLTGAIAVLARQVAQHNVAINNLLPGSFLTERLRNNLTIAGSSRGRGFEDELADSKARIPARRIGDPKEFGEVCAFLCSTSASYIIGQNILVDGGHFNSTFG